MLPKSLIRSSTLHLAVILLCLSLAVNSCSWTPQVKTPLYKGTEGSVSLITESDSNYHAPHPVDLSTQTMTKILRGLHIQQHTGLLQGLFAGMPSNEHLFSDVQITWLAPLLQQAFSQVTREEQVSFQVNNSSSTDLGIIKGTMFVDGTNLVVAVNWRTHGALTHSKQNQGSGSRNPTGILAESLTFRPEQAVKKTLAHSWLAGPDDSNRLVIDYTVLAGEQPQPDQPPTGVEQQRDTEGQDSKPSSSTSAADLGTPTDPTGTISPAPSTQPRDNAPYQTGNQDFLNEIRALRQQLEAQQAEIDALKNK